MKGFGIHGSTTDHAGIVLSTQSRSSQMGNLFLRAGDGFACPKCKCWSTLIKSNDHVIFDGKPVAYVGDKFTCGATLLPKQSHVVGENEGNNSNISTSSFSNTENSNTEKFLDRNYAIELLDIEDTPFVPLGIPSFDGKPSAKEFVFLAKIKQGIFDAVSLEVKQNGVFVEVKRIQKLLRSGSIVKISWDGFIQDLYNSKMFTQATGLAFRIKGFNGGNLICIDEKIFKFKYFRKDWMDVVIGRKTKKIYIRLRINLKDGGTYGLDTCWGRVPQLQIKRRGKAPLRQRTLSFDQLKQKALQGMDYYWSRHSNHPTGKNILLNGQEYEVIVKTIEASTKHMPTMPIVFSSNWIAGRSCNWELSRKTYYNTGYIEFQDFSGNPNNSAWEYWDKPFSDNDFKHTFAHEMGHEILLAYGGHGYSKKHKGSSSIFQSPIEGTKYPRAGEIDLMKYADENERSYSIKLFFERSVAAQEDVASLLFISGIIVK